MSSVSVCLYILYGYRLTYSYNDVIVNVLQINTYAQLNANAIMMM